MRYWLVALVIGLASYSTQAKIYDRHTGNTDLIYIREAAVEILLKEQLIDMAKSEVLLIQHEHQPDFFGNRMTAALKRAAARGVKVRYIMEKIANTFGGDVLSKTEKYLVSTNGEAIPEIINLDLLSRIKSPLPMLALLHAKFLIIDPGTANEKIILGGRNTGDKYMKWLDAGFILRPLNPDKKHVGQDIVRYFNEIWTILRNQNFPILKPIKMSEETAATLRQTYESFNTWNPTSRVSYKVEQIIKVLNSSIEEEIQLPYQFRPSSVAMSTNDLFINRVRLANGVEKISLAGKRSAEEYEDSDNLKVAAHVVKDAKSVFYSSFTFSPPPILLNTLKDIAGKGVPILIFTNDENSFMSAFKNNSFMSLGAESKSKRFLNKIELSEEEKKSAQILVFQPDLARSAPYFDFLHRKMIVTDRWVITGSDNFSYASTYYCDEAIFLFEDAALSQYMMREQMVDVRETFKINREMTTKDGTVAEVLKTFFYSLLEPVFYDIIL